MIDSILLIIIAFIRTLFSSSSGIRPIKAARDDFSRQPLHRFVRALYLSVCFQFVVCAVASLVPDEAALLGWSAAS